MKKKVVLLLAATMIVSALSGCGMTKKESEAFEIHSFFAFLIKFVATPFIFFYFAILYAYTIKVLLNF
mgnify:CR=1 FL=1